MPFSGGTSGAHDDAMHQGSAKRDIAEGLAGLDVDGHVLAPGYRFTAARGAAEQITIRERTSNERVFRYIRIGANDYEARVNVGGVEKVVQHAGMKDVANGIAGLDASVEIPLALLKMDVASGIAGLDASVEIPMALLKMGVANGIAGLDASVEIPVALLKTNVANGIPGLDGSADILLAQIPDVLTGKKTDLNAVLATGSYIGNNTTNRAIAHGLGIIPLLDVIVSDGVTEIQGLLISTHLNGQSDEMGAVYEVTAADATNFYVGDATNNVRSCNTTGQNYYWVAFA